MKEIKILYRKPVEAEYKEIKVFDNLDDYLKVYNDGKDFVRTGIGNWKKLKNGDETYYSYSYVDYSYGINYAESIGFKLKDIIIKKSKTKLQRNAKQQNCVAKVHSYWIILKK